MRCSIIEQTENKLRNVKDLRDKLNFGLINIFLCLLWLTEWVCLCFIQLIKLFFYAINIQKSGKGRELSLHDTIIENDRRLNLEYLKKSGICDILKRNQTKSTDTGSSIGAGSPKDHNYTLLPVNASNSYYMASVMVEQFDNYRKKDVFEDMSSADETFSHSNVKVLKFLCTRGKDRLSICVC